MKERVLLWLLVVVLATGAVLAVVPVLQLPVGGQETVIDYKTLSTNEDRLRACYSLIQQTINEHNRMAMIARKDWKRYELQLRYYQEKVFRPAIKRLLAERNRLMMEVLHASYTVEEWSQLGADNASVVWDQLFGNKHIDKELPTVAVSSDLEELKLIVLGDLPQLSGFDPIEDLDTDYTEVEEGASNYLAETDVRVTATALPCNEYAYLYCDKGANHFDGDFEHLQEIYMDSDTDGDIAFLATWLLSNNVEDRRAHITNTHDYIALYMYFDDVGASLERITLNEWDAGSGYYDHLEEISADTPYYATIERDEAVGDYGTLYAYLYSDESRETLVDTLSLTLHTSKKDYRYIYAASGDDRGAAAGPVFTGYMENLDLQEAEAPAVDTDAADDLEDTTATLNGEVTDINDTSIDTRGFVWDTSTHGLPDSSTSPAASGYGSYWTEAGSFGTGVFDHGVTGLATATLHYFRAAADNDNSLWGYGDELTFLTKPAAPTNVAATDGVHTDKVVVTWTKSSGTVTGYKIYRDGGLIDTVGDVATYDDTAADAPTITPGAASATDGLYEDRTRCTVSGESGNDGTTHTYKVRAYNGSGDSDDSSTDTGYRGKSALNYNWYESFGDAASNYTAVGNYSEPFDDYTPAYYPSGHYYLCGFNMTDATSANSTADRGYAQSSNVTAIYLYPNWQAKLVGLNASVWAVAWHGETVAANASVTWNVTGNGSIVWSENITGADGRADALISCNVTENVTVCAISGNCSDCGIIAFHTETGGATDLPLWYFAIIGVALVGAFYTKDMMLYIMAVVACGGGVWFAQNSALDSEIALVLTATFVILGAVMIFGILRRGEFSFTRGGEQ